MLSPVTPGPVTAGQVSGVGGIVAGILIPLIVVIAVAAVIIVVVGVIMYQRYRQRSHYVKDDLIEPGDDDGVYKPTKSPKPKEGVSFDNPLYVAADNDDMQQLIGCEIIEESTQPDPGDTGDFEKVDLAHNEQETL